MTREKKELLKKIKELETWIAVDTELGCGFAPPSAYDKMYEEIYALQKKLAHLRHYIVTTVEKPQRGRHQRKRSPEGYGEE